MAATKIPTLDLGVIRDRVDLAAQKFAKFKVTFALNPEFMSATTYRLDSLSWSSVRYGLDDAHKVPNDKRGVYAFVVSHCGDVLPPHGYVLYVGIAGRRSDRPLQARYRDYLNTKKILKRDNITAIVGNWSDVLHFAYAPVPDSLSPDDLMALEVEIASALLPPFSKGDLKATIKKMKRMYP